jgi:hypothetical protein
VAIDSNAFSLERSRIAVFNAFPSQSSFATREFFLSSIHASRDFIAYLLLEMNTMKCCINAQPDRILQGRTSLFAYPDWYSFPVPPK